MQEIFVFNNLTKKKELLKVVNANSISIYTCGPTVYDHSHIGHARSSIVWDTIVKFFRFYGYKVNWTRNITDIDDKIINRAKDLNLTPTKIARIYTHSFHEDMIDLGVDWPDNEPLATQYLTEMYQFIQKLIDNNAAYIVDSDVYFSVSRFKDYGKLKGQNITELEKGFGRIEPNEKKKHKLDFALWKGVKSETEYCFDSPWGKGRPGWHLECSAMNFAIYKNTIDIHGGGDDLIFPHHENEIAQSEAFMGKTFANYWLHNGMIMVNGKKMSKSEGNFVTIKESLNEYNPLAIRLFVLNTHYRMPLNYTKDALESAQNAIYRIKESLNGFDITKFKQISREDENPSIQALVDVMSDDLNTPQALAIIFGIVDKINTEKTPDLKQDYQNTLLNLGHILGFNFLGFNNKTNNKLSKSHSLIVNRFLEWRNTFKAEKNFNAADKIRDILTEANISIKDLPESKYTWELNL